MPASRRKRIFVTGPTGHVGSEILQGIDRERFDVRAGVHGGSNHLPPGVIPVDFDYDDDAKVQSAFQDLDALYLMAPVEVRFVERMTRMIETAKKAGVRRLVHQSQFNADAKPGMQGTWWHNQMEGLTKQSGIPYSILRPNAFMVNVITRYAKDIRERSALICPAGGSRVSFIDPQDIGAAAVELLTGEGHTGQTFSITGPESLAFDDLASILSEVLGRPIRYIDQSDDEFREQARREDMSEIAIQLTLDGYMVEKLGCYADVTDTFEKLSGRQPHDFRTWAERNREAFQ